MDRSNFEKLEIYQLAEKLADEIWFIVEKWQYFEKDTVGKQIVRSADSIGANIDERPCGCFIRQGTRELPRATDVLITRFLKTRAFPCVLRRPKGYRSA